MKPENIVVTKTLQGKEVTFSFRPMSADEAATLMGRLKSRQLYMEAIRKELEPIEGRAEIPADPLKGLPAVPAVPPMPVHLRDSEKYLALLDKREALMLELGKTMRPLFDRFEQPSREEMVAITNVDANVLPMVDVLAEVFAKMFPSEESRKKS